MKWQNGILIKYSNGSHLKEFNGMIYKVFSGNTADSAKCHSTVCRPAECRGADKMTKHV